VSYYSNLQIYDTYGLVDTHIAHEKREHVGKGLAGHEKLDIAYILVNKRPTYFLLSIALREKPDDVFYRRPRYNLSTDVMTIVQQHYEVVSVWLEDKKNGESGYFNFLQRKTNGEH
jgi:hypothetical protein